MRFPVADLDDEQLGRAPDRDDQREQGDGERREQQDTGHWCGRIIPDAAAAGE